MYFLILIAAIFSFELSFAIVDYCDVDKNNYLISAPGIQFTKELSSYEYAVLAAFKSLHCCAKGYRSIEWFKDGKAYPWPGDMSSFILYPESANQTIYSQELGSVDTGNYTCTVVNDSRHISHTTSLTVFDMKKSYMDVPLPTYSLPTDHYVRLGQTARIYCEAFVGKIDLPDATTEVWWERPGFNMSSPEGRRYHQQTVSREDGQIVGAYLFVDKVKRADFGEYVCSISNTEDQVVHLNTVVREEEWEIEFPSHKIPWLKLQFLVICVLVVTTLVLIYKQFVLSILLFFKLQFYWRPMNDGKENDLLICHSSKDTDLATHTLAATLRNQYNFTVALCQVSNAQVSEELHLTSNLSRRLLVVLSPAMFDNMWTPAAIYPFLTKLSDTHNSIICIQLQAFEKGISWKSKDGLVLQQVLRKCSLIEWHSNISSQNQIFWTSLRLKLPSPLPPSSKQQDNNTCEMTTTKTTKAKLSTLAKSNESLEVLV